MSEYKRLVRSWEENGIEYASIVECEEACLNNSKYNCKCIPVGNVVKELLKYQDIGSPAEFSDLAKAKAELLEALFQTTKALDELHPMNPDEPCYIYEILENAMRLLVKEEEAALR